MDSNDEIAQAIDQLKHSRSPKRRSAARKLRKAAAVQAGPALLEALEKEILDVRTWETQYQMIMAVGACGYTDALPCLHELRARQGFGGMIYMALGNAIMHLERRHPHDAQPVMQLLLADNQMVVDGAFQAMAMLRMLPDEDTVEHLIRYGAALEMDDSRRKWLATAAAGWGGTAVRSFLEQCLESRNTAVQLAASSALSGEYVKWKPL